MKTFNEHLKETFEDLMKHIMWQEWAANVAAFGQGIILIALVIVISIAWKWWFVLIGIPFLVLYMFLVGIPIAFAVHDYVDERINAIKEAAKSE